MQKRMTMIRLAAVAAVAALTVMPVTPASAAATPADSALHKAQPAAPAKVAAPTAIIGLSCDSGAIHVSAYGTGLTAGAQVQVTRSVFYLLSDGTRSGETSRTRTETVAANGTVYSQDPFGVPPLAYSWTDGEATIRNLAGSVIVVSPVASVTCPLW